ncbi:hypothetical protein DKX38_019000 [Salix brachista]|uniref:Proteasome alpha-type subunits domain-containing protein n=1 Tax=Salix brachista TaxID=2182728 RepID=A0A5N5KPN9_9ROSI|nr:hypothetical protein DKX38_019000 [Salix brachista]
MAEPLISLLLEQINMVLSQQVQEEVNLVRVVQRRDIALKIKEVSEKVDEIANERARHGLQIIKATYHEPQQQKHTSTSQVDELNVYGRDDEKKNVVSKLLAESSQEARNVDVISLVGLGGIGKTTLAQLAFNDDDVMTHFEKKMWVCVSEPFDEVRIAKAILEQLEGSTPNLVELQSLLQRVSQSIKGMRFLLVLDDVWTENHEHWEQLKRSLTGCARGSRILVTTRNATVATMMRTNHRINIKTLSEDACRSIFNHLAFHERGKDERERLTDIGNEIANKCKGLPLAAKVLGGLMQSKRTREEWECVLSSELWRLDEVDEDRVEQLFVPLLLSYYDLPSVVRRCFLYCAMFPKDYLMKKDELVKMWMAQGYLKGTGNRDMEIVGEDCFQVLAARSFFQGIQNYDREDLRFKMHDIVHDFAQYMTENECLAVDGNNVEEASVKTSIERVRHLSMMLAGETSFPPSIQRAKVFPLCVFKQSTMGDRQCSFSLTTFNPTGKLVQVEHALTAVGSGQTSLGIKASAMGINVSNAKTFLEKRYPTRNSSFMLSCKSYPSSLSLSNATANVVHAALLLVRCTLNHIFIESRIRNGHFRCREKNPSSGDVKKWKSDRVYIDKHGKWRIFDHKKMSRKRCGSLRGQEWKYGSGFVDGIFPVLSSVAHQILNFVRKEVDPNNVWAALDTLPVTHETWDDLINVAVQLRLNKQWDPIALVDAYGQKYLYKKAEETYVDLLQARCIPTEDTYALLIKAYCACGLLEKAEAAFVDMRKYGLPPSAIVYNAYIDGLMKAGNPQRAIEIFQRMKNDGCQPSTNTYTLLINLHGKVSSVVFGSELFCKSDLLDMPLVSVENYA